MGPVSVRPLIVSTAVLAVLASSCAASDDAAAPASATPTSGAIVAPEVRAFLSLCSVAASVTAEDLAGAEATFEDDVHETLHELADRLETTDRAASAALLQAKSKVEADFLGDAPDPAGLRTDVEALLTAMAGALAAVGLETPGCPEQPQ